MFNLNWYIKDYWLHAKKHCMEQMIYLITLFAWLFVSYEIQIALLKLQDGCGNIIKGWLWEHHWAYCTEQRLRLLSAQTQDPASMCTLTWSPFWRCCTTPLEPLSVTSAAAPLFALDGLQPNWKLFFVIPLEINNIAQQEGVESVLWKCLN